MEKQTMNDLMNEIKEITKKQQSASKGDEIRIMQTMLNDPEFTTSVYDKTKGLIGTRCPREEAVKFASNLCSTITGLDNKSANELASSYEFTKKDANFLLNNCRDFINTYLSTGRKLPIAQGATVEASLVIRHIEERTKPVPNGSGEVKIPAFDKVVSKSKCPKYNK